MGNISFTQGIYNPSDSFLHKLDPRSKIIGSLMLIISVLSGSFFSFEASFKGYFLISVFLFVEMIISKISFTGIIKKIKLQKSRGNFSKISVRNFKEFFLIIVPLFRLTIEKVNRTAEIMTVKNFIINGEITEFKALKWRLKDTIYIIFVILFVIFYIFMFYF